MKRRLFVDIDGTLAKWDHIDSVEELLAPGFYQSMEANKTVIEAIRILLEAASQSLEVFTLSAFIPEAKTAVQEKNAWLDKYLPDVDQEHRLFCPCGTDKRLAVPGGVGETDLLLDDYSVNLLEWSQSGKGLKLMNGINGTKGTWKGEKVCMYQQPFTLAKAIYLSAMA